MDDHGRSTTGMSSIPGVGTSRILGAIWLIVVGALPAARTVNAQAIAPAPSGADQIAPVEFELVDLSLRQDEIQVFGGSHPASGDWRSIAISKTRYANSDATCTATFIGRFIVLTAAHCVVLRGDRKASPIAMGPLKFKCTADPTYLAAGIAQVRHPADYAICIAENPQVQLPPAFNALRMESLDLRHVATGNPLLVAGYGCISWRFNPNTGEIALEERQKKLTVGDFAVKDIEADAFTSESDGKSQPALCTGDSGGPAFHGVSANQPSGARTIRGVASRNDSRKKPGKVISYFASLSTERFRKFLACWQEDNPGAAIHILSDGQPLKAMTCRAEPIH